MENKVVAAGRTGRSSGYWLVMVISLILLVVVILVLPAATYEFKAKELKFETISWQPTYTTNTVAYTALQILSAPPTQPPDITSEDQNQLQSVDYSTYFVALIFFGYGGSSQSQVTKIAQFKDVVWLKSEFPTPPEGDKVSPYQLVKIEKSQMKPQATATFRLVNEVFVDKAKATESNFPPSH